MMFRSLLIYIAGNLWHPASALALTMVSQSTLLALGNDVQTMTLGFSTYGSRGITTEEVIPLLAKTGYDAVEITSTKGFDAAPENVAASRRKSSSARR